MANGVPKRKARTHNVSLDRPGARTLVAIVTLERYESSVTCFRKKVVCCAAAYGGFLDLALFYAHAERERELY